MENSQLTKEERIYFEDIIKLANVRAKMKLIVTNQKLIFQKEKGFFQKKFKLYGTVLMDNIKVLKDNKVLVTREEEMITIHTIDDDITLYCSNASTARKLVKIIKEIKVGHKIDFEKLMKAYNIIKTGVDWGLKFKGVK